MRTFPRSTALAFLFASMACTGQIHDAPGATHPDSDRRPDAGQPLPPAAPPPGELDVDRARARFETTTDLMRYAISPGCSSERNECHNSEDFPDLSTEGNLWNLVGLGCNRGIGERTEVEGFCERIGDELRIEGGANDGFTAIIGSVTRVTSSDEEFEHYEIRVDRPVPAAQADASFVVLRDGAPLPPLGGGGSAQTDEGASRIRVTDERDIPMPSSIRQGDENQDDSYGDGTGVLVRPGNARDSYLVRRLLGHGSDRVRMPLAGNPDNPTEVNPPLSRDAMYALMSWINCMEPDDGPFSDIRYDCSENADNGGQW